MPEYSMHIETGSEQYMTVVSAEDAQDAFRYLLYRIDKDAETARVEILEVLKPDA